MFNCEWARALTQYDYRSLRALDGSACVEIGTPFSLPDGSAINLYLTQAAEDMVQISDNADTLFQLGGMGLDVWQPARLSALRALLAKHRLDLSLQGKVSIVSRSTDAPMSFAAAIAGLLALSSWAADQLAMTAPATDMVATMEPFILARDPATPIKYRPHVLGASRTDYTFDVQHGKDLIDIIIPNAQATGAAMRKAGDVQNGPYADTASPLIVVYDLLDSERALTEISILASVTRAVPASRLMHALH